jgi:hypothetical protein
MPVLRLLSPAADMPPTRAAPLWARNGLMHRNKFGEIQRGQLYGAFNPHMDFAAERPARR